MYRYQFTSTVKDLLEAEEAERTARSARAPFRWVLIFVGFAWLVSGVIAFDWHSPSWRPFIWLLLGVGVLYCFVLKPYLRRNQIIRNNEPYQNVILEFHDNSIKLQIDGVGNFVRSREELVEVVDASKGVIFYFSDGVVSWLPNRVFSNSDDRNKFIKSLQSRGQSRGQSS